MLKHITGAVLVVGLALCAVPATAYAGAGNQEHPEFRQPGAAPGIVTGVEVIWVGGYFPVIIITTT